MLKLLDGFLWNLVKEWCMCQNRQPFDFGVDPDYGLYPWFLWETWRYHYDSVQIECPEFVLGVLHNHLEVNSFPRVLESTWCCVICLLKKQSNPHRGNSKVTVILCQMECPLVLHKGAHCSGDAWSFSNADTKQPLDSVCSARLRRRLSYSV